MYDPSVGDFIEEDPIGFGGGDTNTGRYCGNDPINFTDPSGMGEIPITGTVNVGGVQIDARTGFSVNNGEQQASQAHSELPSPVSSNPTGRLVLSDAAKDFAAERAAAGWPEPPLDGSRMTGAGIGLLDSIAYGGPAETPVRKQTDREIIMMRLLRARRNTHVFEYWPGQCQRWLNEFEIQLWKSTNLGGTSCVKEKGTTHFTFPAGRNLGATTGHAAYRVIFQDGTVIYIDNGAFGGVFTQSDIPSDAIEDYPP